MTQQPSPAMQVTSSGKLVKEPFPIPARSSLDIHISDGLIRLLHPKPDSFFEQHDDWPVSNEPEDHLDFVANEISHLEPVNTLLCFSYKDHSLAQRLSSSFNLKKIDTLTGKNSVTGLTPERIVSPDVPIFPPVADRYDILLIRHFLEHSPDPIGLLNYLFTLLLPNGVIYIEVPLIDRFVDDGIPLFLWEQHRVYFSEQSSMQMLQRHFHEPFFNRIYGNDIEPSQCLLLRNSAENVVKTDKPSLLSQFADDSTQILFNRIHETSLSYISRWKCFIQKHKGQCALLGLGHVAHRFLQITECAHLLRALSDSNPSKHGLYLAGISIPITLPTELNPECISAIILGVHDRDTVKVMSLLRNQGFDCPIYSIYGYPDE